MKYVEQDGMVYSNEVTWGLDRIDQHGLPLDGVYQPSGECKSMNIECIYNTQGANP